MGGESKGSSTPATNSDHCGAAVDNQLHAIDVARVVRGEEQRDRCDLLWAAHFSPRDHGLEHRLHLRGHHRLHHRRGDLAGGQHVHPDLPVPQLGYPHPCVGGQHGFARCIHTPIGVAPERRVRPGHEDRASIVEQRQRLLDREQRAARVQREGGIELLLGDLPEPALLAHPGTGPQHVDRALFLLDDLEQSVQIVEVG